MFEWKRVVIPVLVILLLCSGSAAAQANTTISGVVIDAHSQISNAIVRVQATENSTTTDEQGRFQLAGLQPGEPVFITAWASGYYIAGVIALPGEDIEIQLEAHTVEDNPEYKWLPSTYHPGEGENQGCSECHASDASLQTGEDGPGEWANSLPVDEWLLDAHAQAATNPRFLTMYLGQDMAGEQSPPTRYGTSRDYGSFPLPPDPAQPYYGPGYKLDFPATAGNCAACHTPAASVNDPYGVNPTTVSGVPAEGIPCDFCHKIWNVHLDESDLPYANMPGVLSFEFRRPPEGHNFFTGPFDDVAPGEDTYSPLQQQSQFCAPCHFGTFWDTVIYNSYGEWLESVYSDPETGKTCQDCHMPRRGVSHFVRPDKGGLQRASETIYSHRMPGASDEELLQNAVSMAVSTDLDDDQLAVTVTITNDRTGHHIPTDSPLRQLIVLVAVTDSDGDFLPLKDGPTIPVWGGEGNTEDGYYSGVPGTAYAKILQEMWTEVSPTGAYWNPTRILSDNRIPAMASDTTTYRFNTSQACEACAVTVNVKLLFRRAFIELMDQKGWAIPDILIDQIDVEISLQ